MSDTLSLNQQLADLRDTSQAKWPQRRLDIVRNMLNDLERSHVARALDVGDPAPDFTLARAGSDETVALGDVLRDGPAVLAFYRGQW
jgi:hypothetical protein